MRPGFTSLTRTPAWFAPCEGAGQVATDVAYGTTSCPACRGIAQVEDGRVDAHDIRVIQWEDD